MYFEIQKNKLGKPYLKKVSREKSSTDGRGLWVEIGRATDIGIEKIVRMNQQNGYIALIDEFGFYRILVLTD